MVKTGIIVTQILLNRIEETWILKSRRFTSSIIIIDDRFEQNETYLTKPFGEFYHRRYFPYEAIAESLIKDGKVNEKEQKVQTKIK